MTRGPPCGDVVEMVLRMSEGSAWVFQKPGFFQGPASPRNVQTSRDTSPTPRLLEYNLIISPPGHR
jgi:hypothetical protein